MSPTLSYLGELARTHDRDRYLCALFAPTDIREAWFALFAFNYEITHIASTVREEMVGFVRYAWWREMLDNVFGSTSPKGHPVAEALAETVRHYNLPRALFDAIIDAHEQAMVEKQELEIAFLQATSGSLMLLCGAVISNVFPEKAGTSGPLHKITAFAGMTKLEGMTEEALTALGTAFGAVQAAGMRGMDAEHRKHFCGIAQEQLARVGNVSPLLMPFAHTVRFYLRRLRKKHGAGAGSFWLPFTLWRLSLLR